MRKGNAVTCKIGLVPIILLMLFLPLSSNCQDIQFSQFYAAPLYLNPAFAGSTHMNRVISHSRLQWPGLQARYITSLLSFDTYSNKYNTGLGLLAYFDNQGGNIQTTRVAGQYAYELTLRENLFFRPGLELAYMSRRVSNDLIYSSQVTSDGITAGDLTPSNVVHIVDVSSGGLLYSKEFWLGFSVHHLNTPNQSVFNDVSRLPAKYSFVGGYKINLRNTKYNNNLSEERKMLLIPTAQYKFQGKSDQFDVGVYYLYDNYMIGAWYRGIPFKNYDNRFHNNESVVLLAGLKLNNFSFSYSYDWVMSRLSRVSPVGAHELNLTYIFDSGRRNGPPRRVVCPAF